MMNITVKFFGALSEQLATSELTWSNLPQNGTVETLKNQLAEQGQRWQSLDNVQLLCAVNQSIQSQNTCLQDGDEVAFFPPVTGG